MSTRIKSHISAIVLFAVLCLAVFPSYPVMGKVETIQQATTQQATTPQATTQQVTLPYADIFFSFITNEIENLTWDTIVNGIDLLSSDTTEDITEAELQAQLTQITDEIAHVQQTERTLQQSIDQSLAHIEQEGEQASVASLASPSDTAPPTQSVHLEDIHNEIIEQLQQMTKMSSPMPSEPGPLVWETGIDVASTTKSAYDFSKEPNIKNAAYLAWDVAASLLPGVPGSWVKKAADKASGAVQNLTEKQLEKSIKTQTKTIDAHEKKLKEYKENPSAHDNKNTYQNAENSDIKQKIYDGRIQNLEKQIQHQKGILQQFLDQQKKKD
jgi:hypothetical protein